MAESQRLEDQRSACVFLCVHVCICVFILACKGILWTNDASKGKMMTNGSWMLLGRQKMIVLMCVIWLAGGYALEEVPNKKQL